jgi:formylglycine-generating enzyme required for sulfatase activity
MFILSLGGSVQMGFVRVPHGAFRMGSPRHENGHQDDEGEHEVKIPRDYWLGKTAVTRGQFRAFVADTGYQTEAETDGKGGYGWSGATFEHRPEFTWNNPGFAQTDEHPVVMVSWNDAQRFCKWLRRGSAQPVRLPTEAEWERACRGGERRGRFFFGDDEEELARFGNVADASFRAATKKDWGIRADDGYAFTAPVGQFRPNPYGLYDMHGNVWEWCQDWYDKEYYTKDPGSDPKGPDGGTLRVLRGGSWGSSARLCRAAYRNRLEPDRRYDGIGFRVALHLG